MSVFKLLFKSTLFCVLILGLAQAEEEKKGSHKHSQKHDGTKMVYAFMKKGTQKICPIQKNTIDTEVSVDYQGQRVYFCCAGCDTKFLKNPEQYFSEMKTRGEVVDSIQQNCVVSGKKLEDHDVSLTLPGRKVYFCCKDCRTKFKKDKVKYLGNFNKQNGSEDKHEHHEHKKL